MKPEDPSSIQTMFASISSRYDLTNTVLSFGTHHLWKKKLIQASDLFPGARVLDCATGTGDLAFAFEKKSGGKAEVVGTDFCEEMLEEARKKAKQRNSTVCFEWADATQLQYPDASFDLASISFGIRNTSDPQKVLRELGRVVRPGGKVLILEFGQPSLGLDRIFRIYAEHLLPLLGGWITGRPEAYAYLRSSSRTFPCGKKFLELAEVTHLYTDLQLKKLYGGIVYLYLLKR
jgi:demethylmenaquinone methyltransferase/2-methoxy-6-polyprenyl-1,4-benzoquinol methylase